MTATIMQKTKWEKYITAVFSSSIICYTYGYIPLMFDGSKTVHHILEMYVLDPPPSVDGVTIQYL